MPELPEIETVVRGLNSILKNVRILRVEVLGKYVFRGKTVDYQKEVEGRKVDEVHRHGKGIYIRFKGFPRVLMIHLGMTGRLLYQEKNQKPNKHTHLLFHLDSPTHQLIYADSRRFGWLEMVPYDFKKGGLDAWKTEPETLLKTLRGRAGFIKHALMDQNLIAGIGNIYADESLYRAGIHPRAKILRINEKRLRALCHSIKKVLAESIELGGTSVRDFVDITGSRGGFKERLKVYGKEGILCGCGKTIKKITAAGRGTHFCPGCQKR